MAGQISSNLPAVIKSIKELLQLCSVKANFVAIFGSIIRNVAKPNDCDLLLIYDLIPGNTLWDSELAKLKYLRLAFFERWKIRLSILVFNFREIGDANFFIRDFLHEELIVIRGQLTMPEVVNSP